MWKFKDHRSRWRTKNLLLAGWPTFSSSCRCHCAASGSWKGQIDMEVSMCWSWDDHVILVSHVSALRAHLASFTTGGQRGSVWTSEIPPKMAPGLGPSFSAFSTWLLACQNSWIFQRFWGPFDSPRVLYLARLTGWHLRWFSCTLLKIMGTVGSRYGFLPYRGPRRCLAGSHRVLGADSQTKMFK